MNIFPKYLKIGQNCVPNETFCMWVHSSCWLIEKNNFWIAHHWNRIRYFASCSPRAITWIPGIQVHYYRILKSWFLYQLTCFRIPSGPNLPWNFLSPCKIEKNKRSLHNSRPIKFFLSRVHNLSYSTYLKEFNDLYLYRSLLLHFFESESFDDSICPQMFFDRYSLPQSIELEKENIKSSAAGEIKPLSPESQGIARSLVLEERSHWVQSQTFEK